MTHIAYVNVMKTFFDKL